ncbi:MAG: EamA family transporter [Anaerolineae bacterium]|jgi:DME family drug/metabolite transporter|nr:EamA family transporter [Anaerolineae bacterium]
MNAFKGYVLVIIAAMLWATMGLFYKGLMATYALPALTIVFWRAAIAAIVLFVVLLPHHRSNLRLPKRDWLLFLGFGAIGVAAFYAIYIHAISLTGMGVAAVLMYTAPVWVTLFSTLFLGEKLTGRKAFALILALMGCALVGKLYDMTGTNLNLPGIVAGLGAGLTYGAYILFSKGTAQRGTSPWAALAYALALGALCLLPFQQPAEVLRPLNSPEMALWLLILGLIPTLGGGVAFNAGLHAVTASNASIVATLEPVIAAVLGWAVWHEQLAALQLLGAGLILIAVMILQRQSRTQK